MATSSTTRAIHRYWQPIASHKLGGLRLVLGQRLTIVVAILSFLFLSIGLGWLVSSSMAGTLQSWHIVFFFVMFAILCAIIYWLWIDFLNPMWQMHDWLLDLHAGDLASRIAPLSGSRFEPLRDNLNSLSRMLEKQSLNAERQVRRHTEHMLEKTRSLGVLYRISSSLNTLHDLEGVSVNVMQSLEDVFNMKASIIRQQLDDGMMQYVASRGEVSPEETREFLHKESSLLKNSAAKRRYVVPIKHGDTVLGVCCFYCDEDMFARIGDMKELFTSIGLHLGMAIEKFRLETESRRLSIMEERNWLAHELHDSLAQTISSLRFQTRTLKHTLDHDEVAVIQEKLDQLETSIETANQEVRDLITNFRNSDISSFGLEREQYGVEAVDKYINQFRLNHPEAQIFLQKSLPRRTLPKAHETEVFRVIQEAVTNAYKYAKADFIRVLMRGDEAGNYRILIEDDGVGMQTPEEPRRHFGLDMMRDCAARIGGKLTVESEPNEGVRITLRFVAPSNRIIGVN